MNSFPALVIGLSDRRAINGNAAHRAETYRNTLPLPSLLSPVSAATASTTPAYSSYVALELRL
ncbi:hypothetical protein [Paraburkholderia sp. SIMBA_054]|uniref:hypothetical protein n=1 Tax=Paraburkholderia sp. SIMBA_054 TaxID=3085795 RepID=UPI00397856B8